MITGIVACHISLLPRSREALRIPLGPHVHKPGPKIVCILIVNVLDIDVKMLVKCLLHPSVNEGGGYLSLQGEWSGRPTSF